MVLCVGCGDTSEEKQVSFFEQYANSPVFSEKYQKYFVEKYCPESMEFNKKYTEVFFN